jgi:hypothetical protein
METTLEEFFLKRYGNKSFKEIWNNIDKEADYWHSCHVMSLLYILGENDVIVDLKEFFDLLKKEESKYYFELFNKKYENAYHFWALRNNFFDVTRNGVLHKAKLDALRPLFENKFLINLPCSQELLTHFLGKEVTKTFIKKPNLDLEKNEFGVFILRREDHFCPQNGNKIIHYEDFDELKTPLEVRKFQGFDGKEQFYVTTSNGDWKLKREIFKVA